MNETLTFATQLALQAGSMLLEYYQRANVSSHLKADRSIVTEADEAADRMIKAAIEAYFPNNRILSEELQPDYLPGQPELDSNLWIIDPLDGTTNFSLGLPIWGVLITRVVHGCPDLTVQYFPVLNEMYWAQQGQGAFLNDQMISAQPATRLPLPFFSCCSRTYRLYRVSVPYKIRILGSAAYSFCSLARGIAILAFEATPKIWDIAGAWLLVREASGIIETLDGNQPFPLQPEIDYPHQSFPTLAAPTRQIADRGHAQIRPVSA